MRQTIKVMDVTIEFDEPSPVKYEKAKKAFFYKLKVIQSLQQFLAKAEDGTLDNYENANKRIEDAWNSAESAVEGLANYLYSHMQNNNTIICGTVWNRENFDKFFTYDSPDEAQLLFDIILEYIRLTPTEEEVKN